MNEKLAAAAQAVRDCVQENDFSDHELFCMSEPGFEYVAEKIAEAVLKALDV